MKRLRPWLSAISHTIASSAHEVIASQPTLEPIPVYLKPSSSALRKPSFYIPRMRECVESSDVSNRIFRADGLGSALPLFLISSSSSEYYSMRLPLLKAGFKRLAAPLERVWCNLLWGKSLSLCSDGLADLSFSRPGISDVLAGKNIQSQLLEERMKATAKERIRASHFRIENAFQRFNHFPLSHSNLGCKRGLADNLRRIQLCIEQTKRVDCVQHQVAEGGKGRAPYGSALWADMYDFAPSTWIYPQEKETLMKILRSASSTETFIWKPARGSCGRGIYITPGGPQHAMSWERVIQEIEKKALNEQTGRRVYRHYVVQKYIDNPLLLNGKKMDLRLYVAVTSYDPLTVYLHEEGLVRLAAEAYTNQKDFTSPEQEARTLSSEAMLSFEAAGVREHQEDGQFTNPFRHLTNFSIGRKYPAFVQSLQAASMPHQQSDLAKMQNNPVTSAMIETAEIASPLELKWGLQRLWSYLDREYGTGGVHSSNRGASTSTPSRVLREEIALIITRVLMSARPSILHALRQKSTSSCMVPGSTPADCGPSSFFELYGFDIILDAKLKPKLIEVNTMPSLESSSDLDYAVKSNVMADLLNLSMMEPFERPPEALAPFVDQSIDLRSPDAAVKPYIHTLDKLLQTQYHQASPYSPGFQKAELRSKLEDELRYARGFKRIFPPVSTSEPARNGASSEGYPVLTSSHDAKRDLEAYAALGLLCRNDEWGLDL